MVQDWNPVTPACKADLPDSQAIVTQDVAETHSSDYTADYTSEGGIGPNIGLEELAAALRNLTPDERAALRAMLNDDERGNE